MSMIYLQQNLLIMVDMEDMVVEDLVVVDLVVDMGDMEVAMEVMVVVMEDMEVEAMVDIMDTTIIIMDILVKNSHLKNVIVFF